MKVNSCERTSCPANHKLVNEQCEITNCPAGYIKEGKDCVTQCPPNTTPVNGQCIITKCDKHCKLDTKTSTCIRVSCPDGYTLTEDKKCIKVLCSPGFTYVKPSCIRVTCPLNFRVVKNGCERFKCDGGQIFRDGKCYKLEKCPENFEVVKGECVRTKCPVGYTKINNDCVKTSCLEGFTLVKGECYKELKCPVGFQRIGKDCVKKSCEEGFTYNQALDKCIKSVCPTGFTFNPVTKKCDGTKGCPSGSVVNTKTGKCEKIDCPAGFTFEPATQKCVRLNCPEGYFWDEKIQKCILKGCPPGYYLDKVSGKCTKIYCRDGFVLEMKTNECLLIKTLAPLIKIDNSDLSYTDYVLKMMTLFGQLEDTTKTDVYGCGLNLAGATKRCESVHGKDACEIVSPTMIHSKCPTGTVRMGCCTCAAVCPDKFAFIDGGLYCEKAHVYTEKTFTDKEACRKANFQDCDLVDGVFTAPCRPNYTKITTNTCAPVCPTGFQELGNMCLKPQATELGTPFTWTNGDN